MNDILPTPFESGMNLFKSCRIDSLFTQGDLLRLLDNQLLVTLNIFPTGPSIVCQVTVLMTTESTGHVPSINRLLFISDSSPENQAA